jgi:polyhydroxybutyrate depolymerase
MSWIRLTPLRIVGMVFVLASAAHAQTRNDLTIQTADGARHAIVIPAGAGPHPTVLVLHGALGTAAGTVRDSGFAEAAAKRGFTAVFPDGIDRQWHDGRAGGVSGPDDIGFIRALVARLIADNLAAAGHIYIAGISNGGIMSFTMACKAGDLFSGVGTVIANMPAGIEPCTIKPVPLVMINGTADPIMPFAGGDVGLRHERGQVWGTLKTADLFAHTDGCAGQKAKPLPDLDPSDGTTVTRIDWTGCRPGTSVTLYRIEGGGHAVAGRPPLSRRFLGPSNQYIVGADVIMDVFAAKP